MRKRLAVARNRRALSPPVFAILFLGGVRPSRACSPFDNYSRNFPCVIAGRVMDPPDLPGFVFDRVKNRYFRVQKRARENEPALGAASTSLEGNTTIGVHNCRRLGPSSSGTAESVLERGVLGLIQQRELFGCCRHGRSTCSSRAFQGEYAELGTARPRVWKYSKTSNWADGGLQQLRVGLQTAEGEVEADVMVLGGTNGRLGVWQISEADDHGCCSQIFPADHCLPTNPDLWTGEEKDAPVLWPSMKTVVFPSEITSIKRLNEWLGNDRLVDGNRLQQSLIITTLGSGVNGGALYLLSPTHSLLSNPLEHFVRALPFGLSTTVTTEQSIWTSEANPRGKSASLGMSEGAAIVDLETGQLSWLCRCSSDVLSQQLDSSGNVVLCGFRNGVISTIDLRLPQPLSPSPNSLNAHASRRSLGSSGKWRKENHQSEDRRLLSDMRRPSPAAYRFAKGQHNKHIDKLYCSHSAIMQMNSAICSLVLCRSSEWYLLASAMNGDIQQWDRRAVEHGPVRSFEGNKNSHSVLQLAVDPTERLLVSGGEDCAVRLWSLESGRLLQEESGLTSPITTISWPTSFRKSHSTKWGGFMEEAPYENDNPWALWMGSSSGLLHMRGGAY